MATTKKGAPSGSAFPKVNVRWLASTDFMNSLSCGLGSIVKQSMKHISLSAEIMMKYMLLTSETL